MTQCITYRFFTSPEEKITIELEFDDETFQMKIPENSPHPDWARLEHQKCSNCPLGADTEWCPAAMSMARFVPEFRSFFSYDKTVIEVETPMRTIVSKSTFQMSLASIFGLALATSGCPHTLFLRPMARFHLPFANEQETVFRSLSSHLLRLYVENQFKGENKAVNFDELKENYAKISVVNSHLAGRLRDAVEKDAALNAVIILESFALITPENPDGNFEDIEDVFKTEAS